MYRCMICYACYCYNRQLEEHKKRDHPEEDEQKCKECGKRVEDPEELQKHKEDCGTYWCGICDKWFTKKSDMKNHEERKHKNGDEQTKTEQERQWTKKETNKEKKDWKCHLCQKQYRCKKELEKHVEDNHECYLCHKQYRCKDELYKHEWEDHTWGCEECRDRYQEEKELYEHIGIEHLDYNCCYCKKVFYGKRKTDEHEDICNGKIEEEELSKKEEESIEKERDYNCCYCNKVFFGKRKTDEHEDICKGKVEEEEQETEQPIEEEDDEYGRYNIMIGEEIIRIEQNNEECRPFELLSTQNEESIEEEFGRNY